MVGRKMSIKDKIEDFARIVRLGVANGVPEESLYALVPAEHVVAVKKLVDSRSAFTVGESSMIVSSRTRAMWDSTYSSAEGETWRNLRNFLIDVRGRDKDDLLALDKASDKVLFQLGRPDEIGTGLDKIKGLVVGYVQSGKTANYTAVTAKAFDAGFKIVIVLSGIHNALRRQTQIRMDNELGIEIDSPERRTARKAGEPNGSPINIMTAEDAINGDFKYSNISSSVLSNGRFLFVTKKNASVLDKLIKWIGTAGRDLPTLIIDDEADQATINTRGSVSQAQYEEFEGESPSDIDIDPTRINELIRKLISKFNNISYVGYTATPYANVFITHDASHSVLDDDLYPKDFIISLPKPLGYMGPEEFFGASLTAEASDEIDHSESVIEIVSHEEVDQIDNLDANRSSHESGVAVPPKLRRSIMTFILGTAARRTFEGKVAASSMLIHASHLKEKQKELAKLTQEFVDELRTNWRYDKDAHGAEWVQLWHELKATFRSEKFTFEFQELENHLNEILGRYSPLPVLLLNYSSDDELDYEADPNLTAIVIGGNKLSRGLTLEGLLVSYFVRKANAPKADTLTQMGRFFGYRADLIELTRIFTTDELRTMFIEISLVESALRRELAQYDLDGKTPKDYAPRVRARSLLMPTARNKMRSAVIEGVSYSGDLVQTTSFPKSTESPRGRAVSHQSKLDANLESTSKFIANLMRAYGEPAVGTSPGMQNDLQVALSRAQWDGVDWREVVEYLGNYYEIEGATRFVTNQLTRYITDLAKSESPELVEWTVAVAGRSEDSRLGGEAFSTRFNFGRIERALANGSFVSIGALVNPLDLLNESGDELLGFTGHEITKMIEKKKSEPELKSSEIVRSARPKTRGLLVIYPVSPESIGRAGQTTTDKGKRTDLTLGQALFESREGARTVVGLAISFPISERTSSAYWAQES